MSHIYADQKRLGKTESGDTARHVRMKASDPFPSESFLNDRTLKAETGFKDTAASMPTATLSGSTAASAAGPIQADKKEDQFKKAQDQQLQSYMAIADLRKQDPEGYTQSKAYKAALKRLNSARSNEAKVQSYGIDPLTGYSTTGPRLLDALRSRNTKNNADGTGTFDESGYFSDVDAALDASPDLWNQNMPLRRRLRGEYSQRIESLQDAQLAIYSRNNTEFMKPFGSLHFASRDDRRALADLSAQERAMRKRIRDDDQPASTGSKIMDMLRRSHTQTDEAGNETFNQAGYFKGLSKMLPVIPEDTLREDKQMQERISDEVGELSRQKMMGMYTREEVRRQLYSPEEIQRSWFDQDPETSDQDKEVGYYARSAMHGLMSIMMGDRRAQAFDSGGRRNSDEAMQNFSALAQSSGVSDLLRRQRKQIFGGRAIPSVLRYDENLQSDLLGSEAIAAAEPGFNASENASANYGAIKRDLGQKRRYRSAGLQQFLHSINR